MDRKTLIAEVMGSVIGVVMITYLSAKYNEFRDGIHSNSNDITKATNTGKKETLQKDMVLQTDRKEVIRNGTYSNGFISQSLTRYYAMIFNMYPKNSELKDLRSSIDCGNPYQVLDSFANDFAGESSTSNREKMAESFFEDNERKSYEENTTTAAGRNREAKHSNHVSNPYYKDF